MKAMLDQVYEQMEGSDASLAYSVRHGIASQAVLTITDDETAGLIALRLAPRTMTQTSLGRWRTNGFSLSSLNGNRGCSVWFVTATTIAPSGTCTSAR